MSTSDITRLLREYLEYLQIEKNRSRKTVENYERYLTVFIKKTGVHLIQEVTSEVIRNFRLVIARGDIKKITQSYYIIAIRNFLKYCIKQGYEVLSPETIEVPKIARRDIEVLDYNELERLLKAPEGNDIRTARDRAILETLFSTGLRVSELCALNRYVDMSRGELSVRGKGEKVRVVFFSERARRALDAYLKKRIDTEEALFVSFNRNGKLLGRITSRAVQRLVERYARRAGISKKVHPHQLRHSFATDLLINGADIRSVQELLGHANIATTQVYTHLTNKELREVHEAFHARRRNTK